ncbi:hypothetical protein ACJX0J_039204, partial [Zea mays]
WSGSFSDVVWFSLFHSLTVYLSDATPLLSDLSTHDIHHVHVFLSPIATK